MNRSTRAPLRRLGLLALAALMTTGCIFTPLAVRRPARTLWSLHDVESWPSRLEAAPTPPDPATLTLAPGEEGASMVLLSVRMVVTHEHVAASARTPPREYTHFDLTRVAWLVDAAGAHRARVFEVLPPDVMLGDMVIRTVLPGGRAVGGVRPTPRRLAPTHASSPQVLTFAFPQAAPGAVVVWRYRLTKQGIATGDRFHLSERDPVRAVEYVVRTYADFDLDLRGEGMALERSTHPGHRVELRWSASGLPLAALEPGMAPPSVGRVWAEFVARRAFDAPFAPDWYAVAERIHAAMREVSTHLPAALVAPAPAEAPTAAAWRRVMATFASDVGVVPEGAAGFSDDYRRRRVGDGGAAMAIGALLGRWGHRCDLLYTSPAHTPPLDFAYPASAGNAALLVGCGELILDPACRGCAPGELHPLHRGRAAIRIGRTTSGRYGVDAATLPDPVDPPIERRVEVAIEPQGAVTRGGEVTLAGMRAAAARVEIGDGPARGEQRAAAIRRHLGVAARGGSAAVFDLETPTAPLRLTVADAALDGDALAQGAGWATLSIGALLDVPALALLDHPTRRAPVRLDPSEGANNRVRLAVPAGARVAALPPPVVIETPYGAYHLDAEAADGAVVVTERLTLARLDIDPSEWPALRELLAAARAARARPVVLRIR